MGLYDATAAQLNQAAWKEWLHAISEGSHIKRSEMPACKEFDTLITPCTDGH